MVFFKQLKLDLSMSKMLQILSVNPFQKVALYQLLTEHSATSYEDIEHNQLLFNDF